MAPQDAVISPRNGPATFEPEQIPDETSPLLHHLTSDPPNPPSEDDAQSRKAATSPLYPFAIICIFALSFFADVGGSLVDTPEVRLLEMAVCRDYYRKHDPSVIGEPPLSYVDEKLCKVNEIQSDLAYIRAVKSLLMTIPGEDL
jgi:hypothetical protein